MAAATRPAPIGPPVVLVPRPPSTDAARGLLPGDGAARRCRLNAGRAALLVAALTGDPPALLLAATEDRLHQAYRGAGHAGHADLVAALRAGRARRGRLRRRDRPCSCWPRPGRGQRVRGRGPRTRWTAARPRRSTQRAPHQCPRAADASVEEHPVDPRVAGHVQEPSRLCSVSQAPADLLLSLDTTPPRPHPSPADTDPDQCG